FSAAFFADLRLPGVEGRARAPRSPLAPRMGGPDPRRLRAPPCELAEGLDCLVEGHRGRRRLAALLARAGQRGLSDVGARRLSGERRRVLDLAELVPGEPERVAHSLTAGARGPSTAGRGA